MLKQQTVAKESQQIQTSSQIQPFVNPICKSTYEALPKIYGTKKSNKHSYDKLSKQIISGNTMTRNIKRHCCFNGEKTQIKRIQILQNDNKYRKSHNKSFSFESFGNLSKPKKINCQNKYCPCRLLVQTQKKKSNKKQQNHLTCHQNDCSQYLQNKSKRKQIRMKKQNQLNRSVYNKINQLDDYQSKHKVIMNKRYSSFGIQDNSALMDLISQSKRSYRQLQSIDQKSKNKIGILGKLNDQKMNKNEKIGKTIKQFKKQRFWNKKKIKNKQDQKQFKETKKSENYMKNTKRKIFQTQPNFSSNKSGQMSQSGQSHSSNTSNLSIFLSKHVFEQGQHQTTIFKNLNEKQKSVKQLKNRVKSTLSNGLFRIPEEDQCIPYLKNYKPMSKKFKIKKLVKEPNFQIIKSSKSVYFGAVLQKKMHGEGLLVTEKEIFQGQFKDDIKQVGLQRNLDGIYEGSFVNGLRMGQGKYSWNNGETFQGEWAQGMKHGYGTWTSPKGDYYAGQWQHNRQQGKGTFYHKNSTYKGEFNNFLKHGNGKEKFQNGDQYEGQYKQGKPDGWGEYKWIKGGSYQGQFKQGMRQGKGKLIDKFGTIYQGYFKMDLKHGQGIQSYNSGEYFQGIFHEGIKIEGTLFDLNSNTIQIVNR